MEREKWLFIDSGNCDPAYNMALDEALLTWHSEGKIPLLSGFTDGIPRPCPLVIFKKLRRKSTLRR